MTIDVATGIVRILKQEGVDWVSTFPVCRVNNALGREGVPMLMMRDDRYAVAVADAFSRITAGSKIGVCTFQGGFRMARRSCASPMACRPAPRATASTMSTRQ
jgi:thiamine pyrophosphate-dependent acetolactate synthase large subunit-like protein